LLYLADARVFTRASSGISGYLQVQTCVVERTSLNKSNARHHGGVGENGRTALGTKVSINRLIAFPFVVKRS
jgi:hypothetical protein